MASPNNGTGYNIGATGASWAANVYAKQLDRLAYVKSEVWKYVREGEPLKNSLVIPLHANLSVTSTTDSTDMSEPIFVANTETNKSITPGTISLPITVNDNMLLRMMLDPMDDFRTSIEMAMWQNIDFSVCNQFIGLTTNQVGSFLTDIDLPTVLQAKSMVKAGALEYARNGQYHFCYHDLQDDAVMGISQFTAAYSRGDRENPSVGGTITEAYGIQYHPTSAIRTTGGGFANAMFIERAFVISFNKKPTIKYQNHGFAQWLLGLADYGVGTVRDRYACIVKSKNS